MFEFSQDEEINELSQMIERLREQMLEQEDLISMGKRDYETLQQDMTRIQADNDSAKDEVSVVVCLVINTIVNVYRYTVQANNESISSVMMLYVMNFAKLLLQN